MGRGGKVSDLKGLREYCDDVYFDLNTHCNNNAAAVATNTERQRQRDVHRDSGTWTAKKIDIQTDTQTEAAR